MELDAVDKKLLSRLYHDYRGSMASIAKACGISKDQVAYRLKRFEKTGIVVKYLTMFDYSLLGYNFFAIVWVRCRNNELIRADLEQMKNVISYSDLLGGYDLLIDCVFPDQQTFEQQLNIFLRKHKDAVVQHTVFIVTHFELFDMKVFGIKKSYQSYTIINPKTPLEISETDKKVMKLLEHDGRMRVIDIAKKTSLSSPAVVKKLRELKQKGIIQGVRILVDINRFYSWAEVLLSVRALDEKTRLRILEFCREHPSINLVFLGIGTHNCIIQVMYKEDKELRQAVSDVLKAFREDVIDYELALVQNEGTVRTLPF